MLGQPRTLQSVARDVGDTPANAMRALFEGPNTDELQAMLRSAIPPGTRLLDVGVDGGELIVNVSSDLQQLTGEALIDGVAQIVLTASEITGVSSVAITDRRSAPTMAGRQRRAAERAADALRLPRPGAVVATGVPVGSITASERPHLRVPTRQESNSLPRRRAATLIATAAIASKHDDVADARQREDAGIGRL